MEVTDEKSKLIDNARDQRSEINVMLQGKKPDQLSSFKYLGSIIGSLTNEDITILRLVRSCVRATTIIIFLFVKLCRMHDTVSRT